MTELRHHDYSVVVVDDCTAEANPAATELLWQSLGMAVPVQINFAFHGGPRLAREVQAAIGRREQQQVQAMRAAASLLESELKSTVTGLLLQSQLALAEPEVTPKLAGKLELVAELASSLRRRLEHAQAWAAHQVPLRDLGGGNRGNIETGFRIWLRTSPFCFSPVGTGESWAKIAAGTYLVQAPVYGRSSED